MKVPSSGDLDGGEGLIWSVLGRKRTKSPHQAVNEEVVFRDEDGYQNPPNAVAYEPPPAAAEQSNVQWQTTLESDFDDPNLRNHVRIAVIGAGIAGLKIAIDLINLYHFPNVRIYEATDRIGGRICPFVFDDGVLELGALGLRGHDSGLYGIAQTCGATHSVGDISESVSGKEVAFYTEQGTKLTKNLAQCLDKVAEAAEQEIKKLLETSDELPNESVGDIFKRVFKQHVDANKKKLTSKEQSVLDDILNFLKKNVEADNACADWTKLSLRTFAEQEEYPHADDERLRNDGFQTLLMSFLRKIPDKCLKLQTEVIKVTWEAPYEDDKKGRNRQNDYKVQLNLADGKLKFFDHVFVTCSLGFLKSCHTKLFQPSLPKKKADLIKHMGFDTIDNVYFMYETAFWPKRLGSFMMISDNKSDGLKSAFHVVEALPSLPNVLLAVFSGKNATKMEQASDDEIADAATAVFQKLMPKTDIPKPAAVIRSKWAENKFTKGSFCHYTKDADKHKCNISDLAEPLLITHDNFDIPLVLFAGEATHATKFQTAHGAMESGELEAKGLDHLYDDPDFLAAMRQWKEEQFQRMREARLADQAAMQAANEAAAAAANNAQSSEVNFDEYEQKPPNKKSSACVIC